MALEPVHELHTRRFGRNVGIGVVLGAFVALIFGLTIVKVQNGDPMEGFDHTPRASIVPAEGAAP
jgi:hypothetical protein